MSHKTYNYLWSETQRTVDETTQTDIVLSAEKPQKDKKLAQVSVSELYFRYVTVVNRLDQCYDQIVQPQKRLVIRKLLDASIGRLLELKHELVNLDLSEFSYNDDVLLKLKLSPTEAEVNIPVHYRRERENEIKKRRKDMDDILKKLGFYEEEVIEEPMTEIEAVRLLQRHERARQGRLRFQFMKEIRLMKEKGKVEPQEGKATDGGSAALKIQKVWRGYITRRKMKQRKLEEMLLIGMLQPSFTETSERQRAEEIKEIRRQLQSEYQKDYERSLVEEKEKIMSKRGATMKEEIADEIRNWYIEYEKETGKFPEIPSEESGGSALIFQRQGAESEISKSTTASSVKSKKGKKEKEKEGKKPKKDDDEEDPGFKMTPSNFLSDIMSASEEYQETWKDRDESNNPRQTADIDMIRMEKTAEVESELRKIVDQLMRKELEILQAALDRDRAKKGKKARKSAKKKGRSGKKSKKKKEKDLTPDRTLESLFEELITNGIIKKYPEIPLSSFHGEHSLAAHDLRKQGKDPPPSLGDVRQIIKEYCILPLGSNIIHQMAPLVKSLMIVGPHGSGKDMLVHAICTEVGAVFFDLSPANIVGKYPGKSGLIMLVHLVNKVSRLLQPSVIYMDGAEKPFLKKVPKTDKTDPKRLKKDLPKLVKGIAPEDQIMLLGVSHCPWECDQKALAQTYNKFVMIPPRPDYGSISSLWKELLFQFSGVNRQFDTAAMTKLSDGYTVGSILKVVQDVMTCKRVLQLRIRPLTHAELINELCKQEPVYKEEEESFMQWYAKTPIGKRKARALEIEAELKAENQTQQTKK
ncbi:dynein regulatory complex protein 11 [Schistocerca piceifrons]|uniref:dynein regulatory complex protein 11 n=1 Tax=Schistocerca piceifrons TaxID=274613 RepID=UPI001F5FC7A1|nr:dynein regulatory complex protein 11 [Schistocerca piceifrons]